MSSDDRRLRVAVIGAGFGGVGMAIRLRECGLGPFRVFEKAEGIGGTWWTNRYPGCACDVPSHLYSFSFAPNPGWTRRYAPRAEIQEYLVRCAERFGVAGHVETGCGVTRMTWNDGARAWDIDDERGRSWTADFVVSAIGGLSRPAFPDLAGLEDFAGRIVHSQQWDESVDVDGKRVAVVGTGASAVQFVPAIAGRAKHVDVYQRSAQWILPRHDRAIPRWRRKAYARWPLLQR
ncbi:MAG: NAD(P)/FAD-dependent oxidoreductase, partial [Wenzhouxiangellaceae bacterium]|nr:NAD(P)/FAD-dependent oxidoreductase [Wenzhouxiangellaceae bacterium]